MDSIQFPRPTEPFLDRSGLVSRWWYDYLRTLTSSAVLAEMQAQIAANAAAIAELQNAGGFSGNVVGIDSVFTYGQLADGTVWVTLQGDTLAPGATYYYGTGPDGAKGWYRLYDSMAAGVGLVITDSGYVVLGEVATPDDLPGSGNSGEAWRVLDQDPGLYVWDGAAFTLDPAADGTVGFRLAELPDSATGTLQGITRDAYGRVSGTTDATITGTSGQIEVANGDAAAGPPTLSLADVADAGGGTLQRFERDGKGRVSGTSAATTDDLSEGSSNLYFTDARAIAAVGGMAGGEILVTGEVGPVALTTNDETDWLYT